MHYVVLAVQSLVVVVFLVSSAGKLKSRGDIREFTASLRRLRILPASAAGPAAFCVLAAEVAIWVLLVIPVPVARTAGFFVAAGLLTVFAAGITLSLRRGEQVPCRCFGASTTPLGPWHVVRNLLLAGAAAVAPVLPSGGAVRPGGLVVAVCAGLLLGALVALFDDLVALFRPVPSPPHPGP
ncbi:MauE/DoxX family redox-associated membrane protein [Streptomyces sp. enrichment culture]|uniref:MauE/DoxX family redox-associated membrane protein n=1 Tax=Streptomyces sp. enrichment culture TaxID=1795815 RepID=UPI003F579813